MGKRVASAPGDFYHLYNRGTDKRKIFLTKRDYERFLSLLYVANSKKPVRLDDVPRSPQGETLRDILLAVDRGETVVDLAAYCLMPNHFHLLVKEKEAGSISRFMQKLTTGYTMYFNKRHGRSGVLLQGVFKSEHVAEDRYLKYLVSYIHLNPIKLIDRKWKENGIRDRKKAEKFLEQYMYSSYIDYGGIGRLEQKLITKRALPHYFETSKDFKASVTEWLGYELPP
jgi:putative transposase